MMHINQIEKAKLILERIKEYEVLLSSHKVCTIVLSNDIGGGRAIYKERESIFNRVEVACEQAEILIRNEVLSAIDALKRELESMGVNTVVDSSAR